MPGLMETDESDTEDNSDRPDTSGVVFDNEYGGLGSAGRMINREVDRACTKPAVDGSDGAGKAAYGASSRKPVASVAMENWMMSMLGAEESVESGTSRARDLIFAPEQQGAEFLGPGNTEEFVGMITSPPQNTPLSCQTANHFNYLGDHDTRGRLYQGSFEMIRTGEQLRDVMSGVIRASKYVSVKITPDMSSR